jgi:hypothetical protein
MSKISVRMEMRAAVERLQAIMSKMPQADLPTQHHFADGVYMREMHCPAGCTIVGKVHRREHFFILASGEMELAGDGLPPRLVKAPAILIGSPGVKRVGYAHTDCVCINVHRTAQTDLDAIEIELIEPDATALFDARNEHKQKVLP